MCSVFAVGFGIKCMYSYRVQLITIKLKCRAYFPREPGTATK